MPAFFEGMGMSFDIAVLRSACNYKTGQGPKEKDSTAVGGTANATGDRQGPIPSENPIQNKKSPHAGGFFVLERATGIGPARSAWEAEVLPLNYARI